MELILSRGLYFYYFYLAKKSAKWQYPTNSTCAKFVSYFEIKTQSTQYYTQVFKIFQSTQEKMDKAKIKSKLKNMYKGLTNKISSITYMYLYIELDTQ